jgi:hypothetical protein
MAEGIEGDGTLIEIVTGLAFPTAPRALEEARVLRDP